MIRSKKILNIYKKIKISNKEFYDACYECGVNKSNYNDICAGDLVSFEYYLSPNKNARGNGYVISVYGNQICRSVAILLSDKNIITLKLNSSDIKITYLSKFNKNKNRSKHYYKARR